MEDKFALNTSCAYCGKDMDAKYRSKRFCSDKCRVYFGRENKLKEIMNEPDKELLDKIKENNKPENKSRIMEERNTVHNAGQNHKQPLTENEVRHPLWKQGDPTEHSNAFFLRYDCFTYEELQKLKK